MRIILTAVLTLFATVSFGACPNDTIRYRLAGVVKSIPVEWKQCDGQFEDFPTEAADTEMPIGDQCFKIIGKGIANFKGVSRLTSVPLYGEFGGDTRTPFVVEPNSERGQAELGGFSSQAVLTGKVRGRFRGTVYTKDTGYITGDGWVGQILVIVGGTDDLDGASGILAVGGQEVGGWAIYSGYINICSADD